MKKVTSLLLSAFMLFACISAEAQTTKNSRKHTGKSIFAKLARERSEQTASKSHSKDENVKKIATYADVDMDEVTRLLTDTSEKMVFTWGTEGIPTQVIATGTDDEIVEGMDIPYRLTYSNFMKINPMSDGEFGWLADDIDFDAQLGIVQAYIANNWVNFAKIEKKYSANGFIEESTVSTWVLNKWVNMEKEIFTFDGNYNITQIVSQAWENNQWVNESRYMDSYDDENRNLGYQSDVWENGAWVTEQGMKTILTKNASNQVVTAERQSFDEETNTWAPVSRQTYSWGNDGTINEVTEEMYGDTAWRTMMQYRDIVWKNFDALNNYGYPVMIGGANFISMEGFSYNEADSSWIQSSRYNNIFTGNNITEALTQFWNGVEWDTSMRTITSYYPNGDLKETKSMFREDGNWKVMYGYGSKNTYDTDGDLTRSGNLSWNGQEGKFEETSVEVFTYTMVTVGIAENSKTNSRLSLYPNPSTGGNITLALTQNTPSVITVFDNTGRMVMQRNENALSRNVTLDVNAFAKGMYTVQVMQNGKISQAKLMVK